MQAGALNDNLLPEAREDILQPPRKDAAAEEQPDELSEDEGFTRQQEKQVFIYVRHAKWTAAHGARSC